MLVFEILKAILLEVCLERCVGLVKEFAVTDDSLIWRPSVSALSVDVLVKFAVSDDGLIWRL